MGSSTPKGRSFGLLVLHRPYLHQGSMPSPVLVSPETESTRAPHHIKTSAFACCPRHLPTYGREFPRRHLAENLEVSYRTHTGA